MNLVYATKSTLAPQGQESRFSNIERIVRNQLDMQWDIRGFALTERLSDLGLVGTISERFARILSQQFPFLTPSLAADFLARAVSVSDLVYLILEKVGPAHDHAAESADDIPSLFASSCADAPAASPGEPG